MSASLRAALEALAARWADQPNDYDEDTEQQIDDGRMLRELLAVHPEPPVQPGYDAVYAVLREADPSQAVIGIVWRAVHAFREALGIRGSDPLTLNAVEGQQPRPRWTDLFGIAPDMTAEQLFGIDPGHASAERYRLAWKSAYRRAANFRVAATVLGRQYERQQLVERALGRPLRDRAAVREAVRVGLNSALFNGGHPETGWSPSEEVDRITNAVMEMARPMPTHEQAVQAVWSAYQQRIGIEATPFQHAEAFADALMALLNGDES